MPNGKYKRIRELQYHGAIRLDRDVAAICVAAQHEKDPPLMDAIRKFAQRCDAEVCILPPGPPAPVIPEPAAVKKSAVPATISTTASPPVGPPISCK